MSQIFISSWSEVLVKAGVETFALVPSVVLRAIIAWVLVALAQHKKKNERLKVRVGEGDSSCWPDLTRVSPLFYLIRIIPYQLLHLALHAFLPAYLSARSLARARVCLPS